MPDTPPINPDHVNAFIASAIKAVETLAQVPIERGVPYVKSPKSHRDYDVSGGVGLTGQIAGLVTMNFTRPVICSLVTKMLGEPVTSITQSVRDAVGRMLTTMAESARQQMAQANKEFTVSQPMVTAGRHQSLNYPLGVPCIVVPLKTAPGEFTIEVAVR
jgi:CheY-specific phosphatase CheX